MWAYVLLQHLPTVSECVQGIIMCSNILPTKKQMEVVHMLASSLREMCVKLFADKHVITLKYKKLKVTEYLKVYA